MNDESKEAAESADLPFVLKVLLWSTFGPIAVIAVVEFVMGLTL